MSLPVVFPRVFQLRQIQAEEGVDLTNLRLENRGLAPINWMVRHTSNAK